MNNSINVRKQLVISQRLYEIAEEKVSKLGITFPEYIRHLIVSDNKDLSEELPVVDISTEESIKNAIADYEKGHFDNLTSEEEINDYIGKILQEND